MRPSLCVAVCGVVLAGVVATAAAQAARATGRTTPAPAAGQAEMWDEVCWAYEPVLRCVLAVGDIDYCTQPEEYAAPDAPTADKPFRLRDNVRPIEHISRQRQQKQQQQHHEDHVPEVSNKGLAVAWLVVTTTVAVVCTLAVSAATRQCTSVAVESTLQRKKHTTRSGIAK